MNEYTTVDSYYRPKGKIRTYYNPAMTETDEPNDTMVIVHEGPSGKYLSMIELTPEDAADMALYWLEEMGVYFDGLDTLKQSDPELYEKLKQVIEEHKNND